MLINIIKPQCIVHIVRMYTVEIPSSTTFLCSIGMNDLFFGAITVFVKHLGAWFVRIQEPYPNRLSPQFSGWMSITLVSIHPFLISGSDISI